MYSTDTIDDPELMMLESIYASEKSAQHLRQRDLATVTGASLGMTNAILKRLAQKGLIVIQRLNSRNIRYAITPDGMNEIARRSYRYFKQTIRNVVFYRDLIDASVARAKKMGMQAVLLVGPSDLDFILEHACSRHGVAFFKTVDREIATATAKATKILRVYSEDQLASGDRQQDSMELYISDILAGRETLHAS